MFLTRLLVIFICIWMIGCSHPVDPSDSASQVASPPSPAENIPEPQYFLAYGQTHNKFSRAIPPVLRVPSGAVIGVETKEASDDQFTPQSTVEAVTQLDFDPIHPLSGPIYVEGAQAGDILAVTLHKIELGSWGWSAVVPGFGFLAEEFPEPYLKTFTFAEGAVSAKFNERITIPLSPFPGVMGVAPDTDERLSTIPPRANGGNLDDPHLVAGTTVYFPVFVEGALFSIGDTHAAQGLGEVCGTAIEAPMKIIFEVEVLKGKRPIEEPQYETDAYYAVTGFGKTLDEAAKKCVRFMIDYLVAEQGLTRYEAYVLCSLAGDLHIAEVVDVPHMLVAMHLPKHLFQP